MQKYKIDRTNLITYKHQKTKKVKSARCRYLAKSHIVNCDAQNQSFIYVNYRGSIFKKVKFQNCKISGCDFWGTTFNKCDFRGANISDCVFMACKFYNCDFTDTIIDYTTIVNTSLTECKNIFIDSTTQIYTTYPKCDLSDNLKDVIDNLKFNKNLRKCKLLHISDKKYNELNLFLLQQRFTNKELTELLMQLSNHSTATITTYKKLERQLKKIKESGII